MRVIFTCLVLLPLLCFSQVQQARIDQLSFMKGIWHLQHEWGDMEEIWSAPSGDNMMCTYRCIKDGKIVFYEFIVIEQSDSVPVMKLRHYNPGSIGWEDKNNPHEYPLVSLGDNKAVFEKADKKTRLIYELKAPGNLVSVLERQKDGKWTRDIFNYSLSKDE